MNSAAMGLDQYQILGVVGEGVSATVYKALDTASQSLVALKVLSPHLQTDAITLERFKREIQITRLLNHPQIVSIYDLIRDGNETCLVMEYLEGQNLKDYIAAHQPLPVETIVSILRQALDVLSVCHAKNVIHRDLKPQNIIVGDGAAIRLVDFGIAKMTTASDLTQTGTSIGSPEYMAPELFAANTFDPRTDIYALGIIAFEMLAGTPPFRGDSLAVSRMTASLATEAPGSKLMALTTPVAGAGRLFCIFMASSTHTRSPVLTLSPTLTASIIQSSLSPFWLLHFITILI